MNEWMNEWMNIIKYKDKSRIMNEWINVKYTDKTRIMNEWMNIMKKGRNLIISLLEHYTSTRC